MTDGATTWSYEYNADGLRTSRTDGATTYKYVYNGSSLVQMTVGSNTLYFTSDTVTFNGVTYYYVKNLQGDVTGIVDGSGAAVATYVYDAWGNLISDEPAENTIGHLNPLRYRGYIYDAESGLYYLQSRYYDPEIGRFLNADAFASTGQGILGNNMFAYCGNNPVGFVDLTGNMAATATIAVTNCWNPAGWIAAAVFLVEVVVVIAVVDLTTYETSNISSFADSYNSSYSKAAKSKGKSKSAVTNAGGTTPPSPKKPNRNPKYQGKTLYNKKGVRVDFEYNGNGTGNVHIQIKAGKFYYDSSSGLLRTGTNSTDPVAMSGVQELLENSEIISAILKGIYYLQSLGGN